MLYLIKTNYGVMSLLKIGYTKNLKKRIDTYRTHNPLVELISTREGGPELEHFLHEFFAKYSYSNQPEWFYFNDYIVDNFQILDNYILKETLIGILSQLLSKQDIKSLENKYIENHSKEDFQLRKNYLYRMWRGLSNSLSEYSLEGCSDRILVNSTITIENLPFGLGSVSFDLPQILGLQKDNDEFKKNHKFYTIRLTQTTPTYSSQEVEQVRLALLNQITTMDKIHLLYDAFTNCPQHKDALFEMLHKEGYQDIAVYFNQLPLERIKALGYHSTKLDNELKSQNSLSDIKTAVQKVFISGAVYSKVEAKEKLQNIYDNLGLNKTAKATDLTKLIPCAGANYMVIRR